jgi:hypothetical protein
MRELVRCGLWAILFFSTFGESSDGNGTKRSSTNTTAKATSTTDSSKTTYSAITPTFGNGTCPSRTANYITHTLPQQCLRTDRVSSASSTSTSGDSSTVSQGNITGSIVATQLLNQSGDPDTKGAEPASTVITAVEHAETSITSTPSYLESATGAGHGEESDSPLDNANFLSFEEWKKQNLAKVDPEQGRPAPLDSDRPRPGINNVLESLGDEGEIDLDFSGFGQTPSGPSQPRAAYRQPDGTSPSEVPASQTVRSKDAGKTCKERTNYASFDCAAQVLKHNPEVKSPYSVLVENKDSYMLNTCSVNNKFFIVELCNDILIDTIVLANYEFFSSIFRHFRVSASSRYPVKPDKWRVLGTFEAKNTREIQAFLVEYSQIWARYLRIEILSHYGSEYYCPISLLRVHGINMLEELSPYDETAHSEGGSDEVTPELELETIVVVSQDDSTATEQPSKGTASETQPTESLPVTTDARTSRNIENSTIDETATFSAAPLEEASGRNASFVIPTLPGQDVSAMTCSTSLQSSTLEPSSSLQADFKISSTQTKSVSEEPMFSHAATASKPKDDAQNTTSSSKSSSDITNSTASGSSSRIESTASLAISENQAEETSVSSPYTANATSVVSDTSLVQSTTSTNMTRTTSTASTSSVAPPQPSTQESFFKSLSKRLQQLESNSTLSLQYIEEQSRILRDAFTKVEKRQISSTSNFLTNLNETVIKELQGFRQAYDQLWQSTVLELEGQREQYQREMLVLSSRLTLVADELVWQKRMGIIQSGLLLLCLGLVLFARTGLHGYLEVPLVQQMMNKSSAALSRTGWESPPVSPSPENRSPVSLFRRKLWRSATEPESVANDHATDGDVTGTDSRPDTRDGPGVDVFVEPPTPPSSRGTDITASVVYDDADADDEEDILDPRESQSGPSTPTGTRDVLDRGSDMANGVLEHGVR